MSISFNFLCRDFVAVWNKFLNNYLFEVELLQLLPQLRKFSRHVSHVVQVCFNTSQLSVSGPGLVGGPIIGKWARFGWWAHQR